MKRGNMYSEFWFGEVWDAIGLWDEGYLNGMEFLLYHYKCMLFFYLSIFYVLAIIATAFVTTGERGIMADFQGRKGPRKVGYIGSLQPISDAAKLLFKEKIYVRFVREHAFTVACWGAIFSSALVWLLLPFGLDFILLSMDFSAFLLINISILHIFAIIFASWASSSKYASLGGIRTTAQMLSFELIIGLSLSSLFKYAKKLSLVAFDHFSTEIATFIFYLIGLSIIFFIASLAELNRHPFDLPEAEAEPVAGYNVEYTGIRFALFFLAEYLSLIYYSILFNKIYIGESEIFLFNFIKISIIIFLIIAIRALIPRYRYDQLMRINWKFFLPFLVLGAYWLTVLEIFLV